MPLPHLQIIGKLEFIIQFILLQINIIIGCLYDSGSWLYGDMTISYKIKCVMGHIVPLYESTSFCHFSQQYIEEKL